MECYGALLELICIISDTYGVSAVKIVQDCVFGDNDLNVSSLMSLLVRLILQKCDKTEVNLNENQ